jgi:hypothetical protein
MMLVGGPIECFAARQSKEHKKLLANTISVTRSLSKGGYSWNKKLQKASFVSIFVALHDILGKLC